MKLFSLILLFMLMPFGSVVAGQELLMLSDDAPPHMIPQSNSGIDIDITREVLESLGYQVKYSVAPLRRSKIQVQQKKADLFLPTFFQKDTDELFFSSPIISYRPTIFSLAEKNFSLTSLADLKGKRIISFQGATGYFGQEYIDAVNQGEYKELHNMATFTQMLLKNRCDIVVLDYYIFYYFLLQYERTNGLEYQIAPHIKQHDLLASVNAHVGFNSRTLRDKFNQALAQYKSQKKDAEVVKKYIGQ